MNETKYGTIDDDKILNNYKFNTFFKNKFSSIEYYRLFTFSNQLLFKDPKINQFKDSESNDESALSEKFNRTINHENFKDFVEYAYIIKIFENANYNYRKYENKTLWFGYDMYLDRNILIQLSITYQIIAGCLSGLGSAVTYGANLSEKGLDNASIRLIIALSFYGPVYILQVNSLLLAYRAKFSPLAARALGNMIGDVLTAILFTFVGLEDFDNAVIASVIISILFGFSSISYALALQLYAFQLDLSEDQISLLSGVLISLNLTKENIDGTLDFSSTDYLAFQPIGSTEIIITKQAFSKLVIISIFLFSGLVCNLIGFSMSTTLIASFVFQLGAAFFKPLFQILPSSLHLYSFSESSQQLIRSGVAFGFALPEFFDHLQAINIAKVGKNVILSNAVGNLPSELLTAFAAYEWLGESIDMPIRLTILSAVVMFVTQISLHYLD